jgi:5-methylcytosine-specific restriction endonuclease McrA
MAANAASVSGKTCAWRRHKPVAVLEVHHGHIVRDRPGMIEPCEKRDPGLCTVCGIEISILAMEVRHIVHDLAIG